MCDIQGCSEKPLLGWRPLTESQGRKICRTHFEGHKNGSFDLYDAFGFQRPTPKPVKLIGFCACGKQLRPSHRLCKDCAAERERQRKKEYYHRSKEEKPPKTIKLICDETDCDNEREPNHKYCRECARLRSRKSNRERQRRYYSKKTRTIKIYA